MNRESSKQESPNQGGHTGRASLQRTSLISFRLSRAGEQPKVKLPKGRGLPPRSGQPTLALEEAQTVSSSSPQGMTAIGWKVLWNELQRRKLQSRRKITFAFRYDPSHWTSFEQISGNPSQLRSLTLRSVNSARAKFLVRLWLDEILTQFHFCEFQQKEFFNSHRRLRSEPLPAR